MPLQKVKPEFVLIILIAIIVFMSFKKMSGGSVRGTVTPPEAGLSAFLFSGKDTLNVNVVNGTFQFSNVNAGNYKLMIEAAPPYRNGIKDGVKVTDGQFTDAGQLELQK
ncbi:MAG: carboxypeptidase-like regulatory domain-containing protein [Bacteroidota bacterium]